MAIEREHDPNVLAAYVEDRLDELERQRLTSHLASCTECRGALALLARAQTAGGLRPIPLARTWGHRRVPGLAWLPLAAVLVVATAVGVRLSGRWPAPPAAPAAEHTARSRLAAPPTSTGEAVPEAETTPRPDGRMPGRTPGPMRGVSEGLLPRRGGERRVAGKTFRLVAGEWVDAAYDPVALLPVAEVSGHEARVALLGRLPALEPYATLGDRVLVVYQGRVYRLAPAASP